MTRQMWCFVLLLAVLAAALLALGLALPEQQDKTLLSVLILREGEGNAVIVSCGGKTMALLPKETADMEDLAAYLKKQWTLNVKRAIRTGSSVFPETLEKALQDADVTFLQTEEEIILSDAVCSIVQEENGTLTLTFSHGDNRLILYLTADGQHSASLNNETTTALEIDRHSVRILSDGSRLMIRPDFSAWGD